MKRRLLVVGASSGVGLATVQLLSEKNSLIALSRTKPMEGSEEDVDYIRCDVRDATQVLKLFRQIGQTLNAVVNCVGVGAYAPIEGDFAAYWKDIIDTNLLGSLHVMSGILQYAPNCTHLVTIGSLASSRSSATPGNEVYGASKAGLARVVCNFREKVRAQGRGMRVSLITPGYIRNTEFTQSYFRSEPALQEDLLSECPSLRPEEVAEAISWCLSLPPNVEVSEVILRPTLHEG